MRLIIEDDSGRRTVVPFTADEISIGRDGGNTVCLDERNISRRHALLSRRDGQVVLEDLGSFNGVSINGERVHGKRQVGETDIIQIGDYDLALEDETKSALPERPTQPELTASPATAAPDPGEEAREQLEALARMKNTAALQATLTQARLSQSAQADGKPRSERDTDPKRDAVGSETPWPPDFHRFEPKTLAAAVAAARRRRLSLTAVAVVLAAVGVAYLLQSRSDRSVAEPQAEAMGPANHEAPSAPVVAALPERAPEPIAAPPTEPQAIAPKSRIAEPVVKPAPTILPAANTRINRAAAREKARNLYQDAVADVGNGELPAAVSKLQEALRIDPTLPEAHKELGICYSRLKQPAKGAYQYGRYLELAPQAPDADDIRKMLRDYRATKSE